MTAIEHGYNLAVVPVLIGPLQVLLTLLPAIVVAVAATLFSLLRPAAMKQGLKLLWRLKAPVGLAIAVVAGLWWVTAEYVTGAATQRTTDAVASEAGDDWPLFRGDLQRTGWVQGSASPTQGGINWIYQHGEEAYLRSPAVVGNRVYFTTALIEMGGGQGAIVCLDADTGQEVWRTEPRPYEATFASPAISGEYLVVGEGLHTTTTAKVMCLSLAPGREGEILWSFQTESHVESTPVIYDGKVYVGAGDKGGYYCLALEGDGEGNAKVLWHRVGSQYLDAETSLVAANGRFYAGLGNEGRALIEFDADTGEELRRLSMRYPVFSPPAIVDGKLYVGSGNGDFVKRAEQLGLEPGGEIVCVDLETFQIEWRAPLPDTVLGAVAVRDGRVYAACRNGVLYCITTEGEPVRQWDANAALLASPAVTNTHVYIISRAGVLQTFELDSGRLAWECVVGNPARGEEVGYISSPAIGRDSVYVGTQHHGLISAGEPGGERRPVWPTERGGEHQAVLGGTVLPMTCQFIWNYPPDRQGADGAPTVTAAAALMGRLIIVPLTDLGERNGVACLDTGGYEPTEQWRYTTRNGVVRSPAIVGTAGGEVHRVVLIDGAPGDEDRNLHCLDDRGRLLWKQPVASDASGRLFLTDEHVYAQTSAATLSQYDLQGRPTWTSQVGRLDAAPLLRDNLMVLPISDAERTALVVLDAPTGRELARIALPARRVYDVALIDDRVHALTDVGVISVDLTDGGIVQPFAPPAATAGVFRDDDLWYIAQDSTLTRVDLRERTSTHLQNVEASATASPLLSGNRIIFADAAGELMAVSEPGSMTTAEPLTVDGTSWLGTVTSPPVSSNGRLFVGMRGWGLCVFGGSE